MLSTTIGRGMPQVARPSLLSRCWAQTRTLIARKPTDFAHRQYRPFLNWVGLTAFGTWWKTDWICANVWDYAIICISSFQVDLIPQGERKRTAAFSLTGLWFDVSFLLSIAHLIGCLTAFLRYTTYVRPYKLEASCWEDHICVKNLT